MLNWPTCLYPVYKTIFTNLLYGFLKDLLYCYIERYIFFKKTNRSTPPYL